MSDLVDPEDIEILLKKLPEWDLEGKSIIRSVEFDDYMEGIDFVNAVAEIAEEAGHHPDMEVKWCVVNLSLTTHDAGGLTDADFDVAKKIDTLLD
jgi:4a-hydroxytetrahydrobiopterin dehydratase